MTADLASLLTARHLWRPGIRLADAAGHGRGRVYEVTPSGAVLVEIDNRSRGVLPPDLTVDLSDPATAGILLAMLPRGCHVTESARESGYLWRVTYDHPDGRRHQASGDTLGAACAAALISLWSDHG